jgi:hypothetical protein
MNNLIRTTSLTDKYYKKENNIHYIDNIDLKKHINGIVNKIPIKSLSNTDYKISKVWCMKQLNIIKINPQQNLELIAIGGDNNIILILNIITFRVYQIIKEHNDIIFSLDQFKDDPNYLFSSSRDQFINIYKLNTKYKYDLIQKLKKSKDKSGGEIGKIILLSNKILVSGDHRSITIWKSNNENNKEINYEDFYEILINKETCNLLEVNPSIFIATQYEYGGHFQVYENKGESFPLIGELNLKSIGYSTNCLCKINDIFICSCSKNYFFIICIDPLQLTQKFPIINNNLYYIYATKEDYLYCGGENYIVQYKIMKDEYNNNFTELVEMDKYHIESYSGNKEKAICPFDDGRIFFVCIYKGRMLYQLLA